ncbi:unnamed protein product [Prorocentrum cordatum]|uniref:Protein xylosyltransferase n=1 Tax=Prorocentrum cordatum TaxID=2364126 RepID=A0ABN9RMP1_9DINO|nr:unnamed protein product [Polarella glacialis]
MGVVALPCALLAAVVSGLSQVPEAAPWATELHAALRHEPFYEAAAEGHMPKEDAERLLGGIRKASKKKSVFFVTVLDGGMLSMGENMVLSLNAAQCDTPILVVGLGGNVCSSFLEPGGPVCVEVFRESAGSEDEVAWGSHEYWAVVFRKHVVLTLVAMSKAARWAAYSDPDIVYLNCPTDYLINVSTGKTQTISGAFDEYDIVFSPNNMLSKEATTVDDVAETYATRGMKDILVGPEKRRADINTGLFVMRMSPMVEDLMLTTMRIFKDQELVHGHYQQYSLVQALDQLPGVRVGVAGSDRLTNGNVFWGHRELLKVSDVISVHANWMASTMKVPCLKEAGFWMNKSAPRRLTLQPPTPGRPEAKLDSRGATIEICGADAVAAAPAQQAPKEEGEGPTRPAEPGCYVWLPSGCPNHNYNARDSWRKREDANVRSQCLSDAKELLDAWCGTTDARMLFIAPPPPTPPAPKAPGCYIYMPSGCEKRTFKTPTWRQLSSADYPDRGTCQGKAAVKHDRWCDVDDAVALWVE